MRGSQLRPGIMELLQECKGNGIKTAVVTSASQSWILPHLERLKINGHFDFLVTSDNVSGKKNLIRLVTITR